MGKGKSGADNNAYRHGHTAGKFSPTYHSWAAMRTRCLNSKSAMYAHYGGRGISIAPEWLKFEHFLRDMGPRPNETSLDRIDPDGPYSKDNCRWATTVEQARNTRRNVRVEIDGQTRCVTEWCEILGVSKNTVWARIRRWGYAPKEALTRPSQDRAQAIRKATEAKTSKQEQLL